MPKKNDKDCLYCSFCGKSQHEVRKLIAGPTVFICDECVELCMDIIREENKTHIVKDWLPRYTGAKLDELGEYILLTNAPRPNSTVVKFLQKMGLEFI